MYPTPLTLINNCISSALISQFQNFSVAFSFLLSVFVKHHLLCDLFSEIPRGKAELQISPQVVAYVEENNSLTFTCTATALQYSLVSWGKAGGMTSNDVLKDTCVDFNKRIDSAIYQFSCSGNLFNWTILQVTKQQHGDEWFCWTNDLQGTESTKTRIFVKGNLFCLHSGG